MNRQKVRDLFVDIGNEDGKAKPLRTVEWGPA